MSSEAVNAGIAAVAKALDALTSDPDILKGFRQKVLVEQGIALIDEEVCPLCDTVWDLESLGLACKKSWLEPRPQRRFSTSSQKRARHY